LKKLLGGTRHLTGYAHLVERDAHNTAFHCERLHNALPDPPYRVGNELESARLIELFGSLYQSHITFINKVGERDALVLILFGY
jgi:hypothetical protein